MSLTMLLRSRLSIWGKPDRAEQNLSHSDGRSGEGRLGSPGGKTAGGPVCGNPRGSQGGGPRPPAQELPPVGLAGRCGFDSGYFCWRAVLPGAA